MQRKIKRHIDKKKALSIALAVLNGVQINAPLAVPLATAAKDAVHRENAGGGLLSLLNRGGQLTERLFFATAHAATNTINTSVTDPQNVSSGETLVVDGSGAVNVSGGTAMQAVMLCGQGVTLINSGLISNDYGAGVWVNGGSANTLTVNGGTVYGANGGIYVGFSDANSVTVNSGLVSGNGGIDIREGSSNAVTVNGGTVSGDLFGIYVEGGSANTVTVSGGMVSGGAWYGIGVEGGSASTVTVSGGTVSGVTNGVYVGGGAANTVMVSGGTVSGVTNGVHVSGGATNTVTVSGSLVRGGESGILLEGNSASTVAVGDGTVSGGIFGIGLRGGSGQALTISGGLVSGGYHGVLMQTGSGNTATVSGGTVSGVVVGIQTIQGVGNAVTVTGSGTVSGGTYGIYMDRGTSNTVTVNGGAVSGGTYGIAVSGGTSNTVTVNGGVVSGGSYGIYVENGSGNTVNVAGGTVTNAMISGTTNVLNLSSTGTLAYTADGSLSNLTAAGGTVRLASGTTVGRNLTINNLSGSGRYVINTDLAHSQADQIHITSATSSTANTLQVAYDPSYASGTSATGSATVATVTSGSASFTAAASEYGAYSYTPTLASATDASGTTWSVTALTRNSGTSETVRTGSDAVAGGMLQWRTENNNLAKRMGELRSATGEAGMWLRTYRGTEEIANGGRMTKQQYTALQGGWDRKISRNDGTLYAGYALGYLEGSSTYSRGSGDASSLSVGAYASWLGNKGHYLDLIGKVGRLRNNYTSYLNNASNTKVDGSYETWGTSLSAEYGYRKQLKNNWYLEPQAEMNYSRVNGVSYTTSDGTRINNNAVNSLVGRLGLAVGRETGATHYYGKVSLAREFSARAGVTAASGSLSPVAYDQNLKESWLEFALGLTAKLDKRSDGYLELTRTTGDKAKTPWQVNAGVRWNF